MFFKYNLLLNENDFNDILHSLKFNQSICNFPTRKESIKLLTCFMDKSKLVKQNNIDMVTICLSDLEIQELIIQLSTTNSHFLNSQQLD